MANERIEDIDGVLRKLEALRLTGLSTAVRGDHTASADGLTKALEAEIRSEQAFAYVRATRKVVNAIARLAEHTEILLAGATPAARAAWQTTRDEAELARWELLVHRDALGLVHQGDIEEQFPIPRRPPA